MRQAGYGNLAKGVRALLDAETKLKESESKYRSLEAAIDDAVVIHDVNGKVLQVNAHFERTFGWTADEAVRLRVPYIPPNERSAVLRKFRQILSEGTPTSIERKLQAKDGTVLEGIMRLSPLLDNTGKPAGMYVILRDVTKERTLERMVIEGHPSEVRGVSRQPQSSQQESGDAGEEEEHPKEIELVYRKFFQNSTQGVAIVDRNATSAEVNAALKRMLGYSPMRQFSAEDWATRLPVQLRLADSDAWRGALSESGLVNHRMEVARREGPRGMFLVNASVLERRRDGNHLVAWTFSDITDWETAAPKPSPEPPASGRSPRKAPTKPSRAAAGKGEVDASVKKLMDRAREQGEDMMARITQNYALTVYPLIEHLKTLDLEQSQLVILETLDFNIRHMTSLFGVNLAKARHPLTTRELEICQLIRSGKDSREIAETLGLTYETVMVHRKHIRKKLGLKNDKQSLAGFLNRDLEPSSGS
ncbi:MAG: PAS domain S-box protein [Desulfomonile tiedjei]|nr:PAS domain S-box protein [Desulfomonile tiedjei]